MSAKSREDEFVAAIIGGGILGAIIAGAPGALFGAVIGALIASSDEEKRKTQGRKR